jgi:hypothetical protein
MIHASNNVAPQQLNSFRVQSDAAFFTFLCPASVLLCKLLPASLGYLGNLLSVSSGINLQTACSPDFTVVCCLQHPGSSSNVPPTFHLHRLSSVQQGSRYVLALALFGACSGANTVAFHGPQFALLAELVPRLCGSRRSY